MSKLGRIFLTGLLISFLGTLPLGTLNIAAMQISVSDGIRPAVLFALGALTAEMVYVRLSLIAMDWIRKNEKIFRILEWVTLAIIVALAAFSFYAALLPAVHKNILLSSTLNRYLLGLLMSALNPMQIPFWFGWSTVLFTKNVLLPKASHYNTYIFGIGLGTFFGNCVFIFGGKLIVQKINASGAILNWVIGSIFAITAIIQAYRMFRKKDAFHEQLEHPEQVTHGLENKLTENSSNTH